MRSGRWCSYELHAGRAAWTPRAFRILHGSSSQALHFGPLSGSDPKLADPLGRYAVITFTYGTNMGPYQMSRHLRGAVSPHEISAPGNQHVTPAKLNLASADVIDAFMALDVAGLWGDGSKVGADGTQIDTWDDNLLAETSIRYGGYGGIAYRHIADAYIALFSHFIPCVVWEAVFIFAGLLENASEAVVPEEIHADTQGQSLPAFGLAAMLGIELLPRIRNWRDLIFYRAAAGVRVQAHRLPLRRWRGHRLEADRDPLGRSDASGDLDPGRPNLVLGVAPAPGQRVPQEPHLQGLP
jgi:Tn3 transposase DDE domain